MEARLNWKLYKTKKYPAIYKRLKVKQDLSQPNNPTEPISHSFNSFSISIHIFSSFCVFVFSQSSSAAMEQWPAAHGIAMTNCLINNIFHKFMIKWPRIDAGKGVDELTHDVRCHLWSFPLVYESRLARSRSQLEKRNENFTDFPQPTSSLSHNVRASQLSVCPSN